MREIKLAKKSHKNTDERCYSLVDFSSTSLLEVVWMNAFEFAIVRRSYPPRARSAFASWESFVFSLFQRNVKRTSTIEVIDTSFTFIKPLKQLNVMSKKFVQIWQKWSISWF